MLLRRDSGTVWGQTAILTTSFWSVIIRSTAAFSFPVTQIVTRVATLGVEIPPRLTFAPRLQIRPTAEWPLTQMVIPLIESATDSLVSVCAEIKV